MDFLLWISIAIFAGWFVVKLFMPRPDVTSRAQRLTILAIVFAYGLFVLAALIGGLNTPSGYSLERFLVEGVLLGLIAGAVTYGIAQAIHWAATGQTMKSAAPADSKEKAEASVASSSHQKVELSVTFWNTITGACGVMGNGVVLMVGLWDMDVLGLLSGLLFGYGIIILPALGVLVKKRRSAWWLLACTVPLGWIVCLMLKKQPKTNRSGLGRQGG